MSAPSTAAPIVQHRVTVDGGRALNVRERPGEGPAFLLVHGLASNARLWDLVSAELSLAGHRVVAVDQRGHGQSDRAGSGYGYAPVTADLVVLAETMGLGRPVLAGQSWGGNVVIKAGALHPDRWHAIAAVDGGTINLDEEFDDPQTAWEALRPPPLAGQPLEVIREMIGEVVSDWPDGALDAMLANFAVEPDGSVRPHLVLADHRQIVEAMLADPVREAYPAVQAPVLLLPVRGGDPSWARRKEAAVQEALSLLPDGRVTWFDGAHDVHLQQPTAVAQALLELL